MYWNRFKMTKIAFLRDPKFWRRYCSFSHLIRLRLVRHVIGILLLAGLYFVAARFGLVMASRYRNISAVWPASGMALAALLLAGTRLWPGIFLGAALANYSTGIPPAVAAAVAAGNALAAVLAAGLLQRLAGFHCTLDRTRDVFALIVGAAICGSMVAATTGALSLAMAGMISWQRLCPAWRTWFLADAVSILVVTPAILLWAERQAPWAWGVAHLPKWRLIEVSVVAVSMAATGVAIIWDRLYYPFFIFPFINWAAIRLGRRTAVTLNVVMSVATISATFYGLGPFARENSDQTLFCLQSFVAVVTVTTLLLSAVMAERNTTEQALRDGDARTRGILSSVGDGIISLDDHGVIEMANPCAAQLFGYSADCMIGQNVRMLMPNAYSGEHGDYPEHCHRKGDNRIIGNGREVAGLRSDGTVFPVEVTVSEVQLGDRMLFIECVRDITTRKRAEEELRESEERFALALRGTNDGIWDWNVQTDIVYFSPRWKRMLGYEDHEIENRFETWEKLVHPEDRSKAMQAIQDHFAGKTPLYELEHRLQHKDGSYRWILARGLSIRDADGRCVRMAGSHTDITTRKEMIEEIRQSRDELDRRVQARTSELSHASEQMKLAKETAEQATFAKGRFLAIMSHEIRSPMNGIIGMTALLLDTSLDADQLDYAVTIRDSSESLLLLLNSILDYSRFESGQFEAENCPFDLGSCIGTVRDLMAPQATAKGISLVCMIQEGTHLHVSGDAMRLRQILINLVNNAIKFTESGQIAISVSSVALGPTGHELHFAVRDTGIGIPAEKMDHLFKPFCQLDRQRHKFV